MPFYEYECSNCKFYTEVLQKISDAPLTKCPSCGKEALKKLVSAPIFRLKGGGWYETDFKGDKENKRNLAGADVDGSSKPEASESPSKTEAAKSDSSKAATGTSDSPSKTAAVSGSETKATPARRVAGGRSSASAKPVRTAASKARPALAPRSKSKPAAKKPAAKKKGRR
jgi:putative FmdB family regulatory protein